MGSLVFWLSGTALVAAIAGGLAYGVLSGKLGRFGPYLVGLFAFVLVWTIWPYWAIYDLQTALLRGDKIALTSMVDWDSVREGVRDDLKAAYTAKIVNADPRAQALSQALSARAIDQVVNAQINPSMLSEMAKNGGDISDPMGQVRYAFFAGSPLVFRMDIGPQFSTPDEQTIYLLEWNLGWKLKRIIVAPYLLKGGL